MAEDDHELMQKLRECKCALEAEDLFVFQANVNRTEVMLEECAIKVQLGMINIYDLALANSPARILHI